LQSNDLNLLRLRALWDFSTWWISTVNFVVS